MHVHPHSVDDGVGASAFKNEAQRGIGMTVRQRDFARQDHLQGAVQRMRGGEIGKWQPGILQEDDAAFRSRPGKFGLDRFVEFRPERVPLPNMG